MKKIGILLDSTMCSKYFFETVEEISKSDKVELYYIINENNKKNSIINKIKERLENYGLKRTIDLSFFKFINVIEHRVLSKFSLKVKEHYMFKDISSFNKENIVNIKPIFSSSGLIVRYLEEDIDKIRNLDLDLLVRDNATGIFKGDILNCTKQGILSFHHGDNTWNRGAPPGFWEVFKRKDLTGFIIQILTEKLDGGKVIFRGSVATKRTYFENVVNLYIESNQYLAKIILDYTKHNCLPDPEYSLPFSGKIYKAPTIEEPLLYLFKTVILFISLVFKRKILRKKEKWNVAFTPNVWNKAVLRTGIVVKNPPNHFYADPFVVKRENRTVCFVEDYLYEKNRGCISAIEIINDKEYKILGSVIEGPYHMS